VNQLETAVLSGLCFVKELLCVCVCVWRGWQQMLEEICVKNGWGTPTYELHEALGIDSKLYAYKVTIRRRRLVIILAFCPPMCLWIF